MKQGKIDEFGQQYISESDYAVFSKGIEKCTHSMAMFCSLAAALPVGKTSFIVKWLKSQFSWLVIV